MGIEKIKFFKTLQNFAMSASLLFAAGCQTAGVNFDILKPNDNKSVQIALLLPYSDDDAGVQGLARSAENAARLALAGIAEGVTVDVKAYDTAGNAETAAIVAQQAVREGADVIVGTLFAESAIAAGKAINGTGVNVLSMSNNVSAAGGNVFVLGNTFENAADRLVSFAASQGKRRALIVHAKSTSEEAGRAAFQNALAGRGFSTSAEGYEFSQEAIVNAAQKVARRVRAERTDVIFLTADYPGGLPFLAQLLPEAGVDPKIVQYGGLSRWDAQPSAFNLPGIQNGWFTLPNEAQYANFRARYQSTYGTNPHNLAFIAFDGVAAVAASVADGGDEPLSVAGLTRSRGFAGASGIFRLNANGRIQRGMAVASVKGNQVVILDAAPQTFGVSGQ